MKPDRVVEATERSLARSMAIVHAELERGLSSLATIGATAPFVGLFGTVVGILRAFRAIADSKGVSNLSVVAGGISEALVTTALGLLVAVVIERGDVLHCDVGLTVARLNTDTQHLASVLLPGEREAPEGMRHALANANALKDINLEELRPGRTGNEILARTRARMKERGIDGTVYSHTIGLHGHGAGPLIGLWDYQEGVPGRGDAKVIPSTWWSIELQATTPVPEWGGQPVRMAQEEDVVIAAEGRLRWALSRQDALFLVR